MLSLLDPVELEDLVVFRDDIDPRKFYLLPDQPVIPLDDDGNPEFLFIKYIKDTTTITDTDKTAGGGLLQFRTALTITEARKKQVVDCLRIRLQQEKAAGKKPLGHAIDISEPLLAAPLWTSGKAVLATFKVSDTGLVRYATDSAPVDLAGDLGASLNLELDERGSEVFWSAFHDREERKAPIMVTYQLTYTARVSAKMTIQAKRQTIHQKIIERARPYELLKDKFLRFVPLAFTGAFRLADLAAIRATRPNPVAAMVPRPAVKEAIQQSIVNNEITVRIETDESGGQEGAAVRDALFKLATEILSDRVVPALFGEDCSKPGASSAADDHASVDLVQVSEDVAGSGDLNFDFVFDHESTVERSVNPNGPVEVLVGSEDTLKKCFKELRLTDGFFALLKLTASTSGVNFAQDGIDSIQVFIDYNHRDEMHPEKVLVRRTFDDVLKSETGVLRFPPIDMARNADGSHNRNYLYQTKTFYAQGPARESPWISTSSQNLLITPLAMGALRVEAALTASELAVNSATVALRHVAASGAVHTATLELTPKADRKTWFQYTGELGPVDAEINPPQYTYQVTYSTPGGQVVMDPVSCNEKTLEIPSPFKKMLNFVLRPQGSFDGVNAISGDLTYEDARRQYRVVKTFRLESLTASAVIDIPILDGGPEIATWHARQVRTDGSIVEFGTGRISPGSGWIGPEVDYLAIQILPDLLDFAADVQLAVVQLTYNDPAKAVHDQRTFTFSKASSAAQTWKVARAPGGSNKYDVHIRYIAYDRSKSSEVDSKQIEDQTLVLDRAVR